MFIFQPLSSGENWLYENLSKAYYEDFYLQSHKGSKFSAYTDVNGNLASSSADASKHEPSAPTDVSIFHIPLSIKALAWLVLYYSPSSVCEILRFQEELDALLLDVEKGDLTLPDELPARDQNVTQLLMSPRLFDEPILNNVSLADAMRQNSTNGSLHYIALFPSVS